MKARRSRRSAEGKARPPLGLAEFQRKIEAIYFRKDRARGLHGTYFWFAEEVGELTRALRRGDHDNLEEEFADVLAWLSTLASIQGIDLEQAARRKYGHGCPYCGAIPCACPEKPAAGRPAARRPEAGRDTAGSLERRSGRKTGRAGRGRKKKKG